MNFTIKHFAVLAAICLAAAPLQEAPLGAAEPESPKIVRQHEKVHRTRRRNAAKLDSLKAPKVRKLYARDAFKHDIRLSWGDQMFENLVWQNPQYIVNTMPSDYRQTYKERYRYTQHWRVDYLWRPVQWFGLGASADISACLWDSVVRDGGGAEIARLKNQSFWNLALMPRMEFSWFNSQYISLHTALGAGLGINGGTETDAYGRHTLCGLAVDLTVIGISAHWADRWGAFVDLGGLYSVKSRSTIFLVSSRIVSVGVSCRF